MNRSIVMLCVLPMLVAASCGSDNADPSSEPIESSVGNDASLSAIPDLVGTWTRTTKCEEIVKALKQAGLESWTLEMVAGNGFVPGVTKPGEFEDPKDPCAGSVPREHSHFFMEDGSFGSLDWNGNPVDDGAYEIVGNGALAISKEFPEPVTFRYEVDGERLMLDPEIPACTPDCFEAAWSVSVAIPGEEWTRTE